MTNEPESITRDSKIYMENSDFFKNWFDEHIEQSSNEDDFITLKDIYELYKFSDYFNNLNKREKRAHTRNWFQNKILSYEDLRIMHVPRHLYRVNGVRSEKKNVLKGYKLISYNNSSISRNAYQEDIEL